jgi:hypothetical protein
VTGWPLRPVAAAQVQAAALRAAFPGYTVHVSAGRGEQPWFEVVSRDDSDPYCLISDDAREIWHELARVR